MRARPLPWDFDVGEATSELNSLVKGWSPRIHSAADGDVFHPTNIVAEQIVRGQANIPRRDTNVHGPERSAIDPDVQVAICS